MKSLSSFAAIVVGAGILLGSNVIIACDRSEGAQFNQREISRRFQQLDANGDGVLTAAEANQPRLFRQLDQDEDGQVTLEEAQVLSQGRSRPTWRERIFRRDRRSQPQRSTPADETDATETGNAGELQLAPNTRTSFDIPYATFSGFDPQSTSLDIYAPADAQNAPVLVFIHGGSWRRGDKRTAVGSKAEFFNTNGYILTSINYRLIPDVEYPTNVQDVARALAWVHSNIEQYGGNPDRIFLMGHSAGAHLAALVATDEQYLANLGLPLSILDGVVLLDGPVYDVPQIMQTTGARGEQLYESTFGTDPAVWQDASPVTHVAPGKGIPPFQLFYADQDPRKEAQAYELAEALQAANIRADIVAAPNETHMSLNRTLGEVGNIATNQVLEFFNSL